LGNEFAHRTGEVDWLFTVEAYDDPSYDNPKTGDYIMIAVAVMAVSAVGLLVILAAKRKKKQ
jgi:LPXTG-motif cell wall-anchored protein